MTLKIRAGQTGLLHISVAPLEKIKLSLAERLTVLSNGSACSVHSHQAPLLMASVLLTTHSWKRSGTSARLPGLVDDARDPHWSVRQVGVMLHARLAAAPVLGKDVIAPDQTISSTCVRAKLPHGNASFVVLSIMTLDGQLCSSNDAVWM